MAEKKDWRDYSKYSSSGKTTDQSENGEKTGGWRDYTSGNASNDWRSYSKYDTASIVGNNLTNSVNTWLKSYGDYVTNYQKRNAGRKYSYEDAYVKDSGSWRDTVSKQADELEAERQAILAYMDENKAYISPELRESIRNSLAKGRDTQAKIRNSAVQDDLWWNSFGKDEELLKKYGSAEGVYNYFQRSDGYSKKYEGMSMDDLKNAIAGGEGNYAKEEIEWLNSRIAELEYDELLNLDAEAEQKKIDYSYEYLEDLQKVSQWLVLNNVDINTYVPATAEEKEDIALYKAAVKRYGSVAEAEKATKNNIKNTEARIKSSNDAKKKYRLGTVGNPNSEYYDPNYSKHSAYVAPEKTPLIPDYDDVAYAYLNGGDTNIATGEAWKRISEKEVARLRTAKANMEPEELKTYNYYHNTKGIDAAEEYLDSIMDDLNRREGQSHAEAIKKIDNGFLKTLAYGATGLAAGVDQFNGDFAQVFTGKEQPTSSLQYENSELAEGLNGIGKYAYQATNVIGNMLPSIIVSKGVGALGAGVKAAKAAGAATMSIGAAGGAYSRGIHEYGMEPWQAITYGTLVGAAEGALEYAMGGIPALRGAEDFVGAKIELIDNALLRIGSKLGWNVLQEISEEELQNYLEPAFRAIFTGEYDAPTFDELIETAIVTAISTPVMGGGDTIIEDVQANRAVVKTGRDVMKREGGVDSLLEQADYMAGVTTGYDQKALMKQTEKVAKKMDKGSTSNSTAQAVGKLAYTVQNQTDSQSHADFVKTLTSGENGFSKKDANRIADALVAHSNGRELTEDQVELLMSVKSNPAVQSIVESNSRKNIEKLRTILEKANLEDPATYKALTDRIGEEGRFGVSESGKAVIRGTDEEIDTSNLEVKTVGDGKITFQIGDREVSAGEIDWADDNQSFLVSAVSKIENITPADATSIMRDVVDMSKPLGLQLNGIDEAFTYGFHDYSVEDLKAGEFAKNLTDKQMMSAYELGKAARRDRRETKAETFKKMRTAADAIAEKNAAEGKEAPKAKNLTITFNRGNGEVVSFDDAFKPGELEEKRSGAGAVANILHQMGLGTRVEFFESFLSDTLKVKVKDKKTGKVTEVAARVFLDENGKEQIAYSGVYRQKDGTIRVDLNAYNGKGLTLNALAHELTHFIQQWSDRKYKVLVDFLMKEYEKTDMTMHQRVLAEQKRLEDIRGKKVSYDEAYDEVVANAMSKMFNDGKLVEKLAKLKEQDKNLAQKLWEGFKEILAKFLHIYEKQGDLFKAADDLVEMKETFEQLQNMFAEALVEASENYQASLITKEAGLDFVAAEDVSQYSYSSLAEAAGFVAVKNDDGTRSFTRDGKAVSKVTVEDIDNSPIGAFINFSVEMKDISEADAKRQKEMFAKICTMACKTNDFAMTMQFVGSAVFTGMKANADKQYGTTYDFPSICTKTQAVIDAMSAKMKSLGRGLKTDEIVKLYDDVFASGNPVPCPECYVFSRWIGIGGLLDNIKKYQDYYGDMAVEDVAAEYRKMKAEVAKFAEEQGISFGKAKGALTSKLTKEFNKLTEKIEKAENQGEKVKPADRQRLAELEPMMNTVKGMTWLENVYFADSSLKKVNPKFRVPNDILFDLNNGEAFASQYKEAWAFRTTQGAGYGKAITPYAEARLGEGVLVTNNTTNAIKGKAQGSLNNYFLNQKGKLDKQSREALKRARLKQKIQAFLGGQRFQSTSDARYENASDYLLAALEMQAMGGMVQCYTKVDGAVPAFSAWGFSSNQSLMPLNGGLDENGNVQDTPVGGMKPSVAFENRKKHESAGTITIGVNDNHIREMFKQWVRDFIIPYHASGGKADVVAEFRRIQEGKEAKGEAVRSTDYSRTQGDKVLSDEVLRWQGKTEAQIQRIHEIRNARIAILTGGKPNMTVVRSNRFLSALYDKFNGGEWDGVKVAKSKVESQIFPNEFWDQTVTYEDSAKITKDYLEYCNDLGFLHRFSGTVPSNGMLVPVRGYNEKGERVQLTDLAYKYDKNGNMTNEVEPFFWKVLTDRRMYDNSGNYLPQKRVTLNDTTADTVTGFAKHNQGRQYDKAKAEALAQKIAKGEQYSPHDVDFTKDFDYSDLNWAFDLGIITGKDSAIFERTINNEIFRGAEPQSANGEYIIDTGKCLMFTDGDFHNPTLSRVIVFATEYESLTDYAKRRIIDEAEATGEVYQSIQAVEIIFGQGFVSSYARPDGYTHAGQNRGRKGRNGSGTGQRTRAKSLKERFAEEGLSHLLEDDEVFSSHETDADNASTFYSQMGKVVDGMKQEKFGASSVISMLRGRGVKAEEIRWSGIQAFLDGKKSVTKKELLDFINGSMLQIEEESRVANEPRDEFVREWQRLVEYMDEEEILDGLNYFDTSMEPHLQDLVDDGDLEQEDADYLMELARKAVDSKDLPTKWHDYKLNGGENYRELVFKMPGSSYSNNAMRTHWGDDAQGVLAHARIQDFNTFIGKMLFIEEIQSDWHNEGNRNGYGEPLTEAEQNRIVDDILKKFVASDVGKAIVDRTMKHYGLESEAEAYAWIADEPANVGAELIAHYPNWMNEERTEAIINLQNQFDNLSRKKAPEAPFKDNYHEYVLKRLLRMAAEQGYDSIGWTTADIQSKRWSENYAEGYRIEYDQDIPKFLKKYGKQWGTTVGKTTLDNGTEVWSMAITDSMQKSVLEEGQAMYSEHDTDYTNRDLLANAFETLSRSSIEYSMIQDYKDSIKALNLLENQLSDLNEEIHKIRFTPGKRDSERLQALEEKAKRIAKDINEADKKLLSMEASEPLRKVIEHERKKAAQQTKAHVKEIQQNKKLRAEQTELRHKIRKTVRDLDKLLNRGNKKTNVKEDMQNVVSKALKAADILFTDHYGTYDMLRDGIGADLTDAEEALVKTCAQMLKELDKMPTDGYDNFMARQVAENKLRTKMSKLSEVFARERKRLNSTTVSSILGELADAYKSLENSEHSYVQGAYSEPVYNFLKNLQTEVGGAIVKDMTKDQLESVYAAYRMVLNSVRNANKMFNEELKQSREQLGNAVIEEVLKAGGVHLLGTKMGDKISQFNWNNMKPIWLANRIGSETFGKLMNGIFKGQYNFGVDVEEAKQFKLKMDEKYHPRNWDAEKLYEFESSTGKKFSLNLQQIMSLYAFSKREQAYSHLLNGGFAFEKNSTVVVDGKLGIKRAYIHKGATSYKLNEATLNGIINSLTAEQKAYVDEMQAYLSDVMGAKGNEVSMKLYGIKMFNEQFYFPLRSSGDFMERAKAAELRKEQGQINLVNSGFTHAVKPEAKNPIILSGFMDVWSAHCNEMSMYHSMVLPMEDFRKVYNYSTVHDDKFDSASVQQTIIDAYGEVATKYIDQLYSELNAGATVDPRETPWKKAISNFKKAAVMLSGSVVVQQFSSIGRAFAVIDPKYFIGAKVNSGTNLPAWEEMKKYAPVAIIKEMGGFDTGTKGSAKSYIMAEQYGKGEWVKGFFTDEQYRGDIMGMLPAKADEKTWCAIWEATKRETKAKHPKMDVESDEFLKIAGERVSEVIEKTQVYDSVLARSANMRSTGNFMAMATAFMAEPTTTVNLLEDAIRSGKAKNIARAFGSVAVSIVLNNALASIVYAMRDDDDDETFLEKYFQSFTSGMIDDINPMTYYPFLKDIYSVFQGYDVERTDMSVIADVRDALKRVVGLLGKDTSEMDDDKLSEHYKQVNEVLMGLLDAGCSMFGVPFKNVRRDVMGIINAWNTIHTDRTKRDTTWLSFWDKVGSAAKDTIPIYAWTKGESKQDKLYEAIVAGDKTYVARLKGTYKDDDAYHTAVRKALRENDPRIKQAAIAGFNGDPSERVRIGKLVVKDGFDLNDVSLAIKAEIDKMDSGDDSSNSAKVKGNYTTDDFVTEFINGDHKAADEAKADIIATKVANGKTQKEAEKDFVSDVKSATKKEYLDGSLNDAAAEKILVEYTDMDEEEVAAKISYWDFIKENPEYDDFSQSNVEDYYEFAEPAEIPLEVFAQYLKGTSGLSNIKDEWGDVVKSEQDQVIEVIDSLPLTWQQKDALFLAYGYKESSLWKVTW